MIISQDTYITKSTVENAPITVDLLNSLGFVMTGQPQYNSQRYLYSHQQYHQSVKQVVFYHHKGFDEPELDEYPENTLLVKVSVTDGTSLLKDVKYFHLSTAGQLMNYVKYLEKRNQVNVLENEIHNILEEISSTTKEND